MELTELDKIRELPINPDVGPLVENLIRIAKGFEIERSTLSTNVEDDGAVTIEFRTPSERLLFSVEAEHTESGWCFVSHTRPSKDGPLTDIDLPKVLNLMFVRKPA